MFLFSRNFFLLSALVFFISCGEENSNSKNKISKSDTINQRLLNIVGELRFRMSYTGHNQMSERELERLQKGNPSIGVLQDSNLKKIFEEKGFLKNDKLLLSKFQIANTSKFELKDQLGNSIIGSLNDYEKTGHYKVVIHKANRDDSLIINNLNDLYFKVSDVISGGYEELVLVVKYYISNGDNFDVTVYEIK